MGRAVFLRAIAEDRCGELLDCLFDGGSASIDARTGELVLVADFDLEGQTGGYA